MTALAMIFSYIESLVPIPIPVPGVKLGLANMAIMIVMFTIGTREAVFVDIIVFKEKSTGIKIYLALASGRSDHGMFCYFSQIVSLLLQPESSVH